MAQPMKRWGLLFILIVLLSVSGAGTQGEIPLVGPLMALNVPAGDRIILYDLGALDPALNQREIAFGTRWHHVWDFSPDGCRVLFTLADGTAPARLYSARLDGSDQRELVLYDELSPEYWGVWEPDWSPDGARIAFTMIRDQRQRDGDLLREYHVARVSADGGEPEFYSVTGREHSPQWSPDGAWLAYVSFEERVAGADIFSTAVPTTEPPPGQPTVEPVMLSEADLWVVSADGETKYWLTQMPTGSLRDPRWSPDSELISFIFSPSSYNDTFWMIANHPDSIPTQLSFQWVQVLDSTWLPDSTAILASVRSMREVTDNHLWQIPLVGNADEGATFYPDDAIGQALIYADFPRFSADGNWLALRSAYDLALVNLETRTWQLLDESLRGNTPPVWSPIGFAGELACP